MTDVPLDKGILPVFRCELTAEGSHRPLEFMGTSFVALPGVLVTCRHCVPALDLPDDQFYAAVDASDAEGGRASTQGKSHKLSDITHDSRGHDLATASVPATIKPVGALSAARITGVGFDVGTFAYPGTEGVYNPVIESRTFDLQSRWLQGYVTRAFLYQPPDDSPPRRSWEVDITAPSGASGSPLLVLAPHPMAGTVVGVLYGRYPAFVDRSEGLVQEPPLWFSLAHLDDVLLGLAGAATAGRPLSELLS